MRSITGRPGRVLLGVVALVGGLALPTAATASDVKDDPIRLETGHIDAFNLALNDDNSVRLLLKEDVTGSHVLRTPESVELFVKSQAYSTNLPSAGIPADAPTTLYHLPLTQDYQLIWPGWDSQSLAPVYGSNAKIDIRISSVDGPGDIYLWTNGTWGSVEKLLTDGWKLPGTIHQDFVAHVHANWGFTEPGTYTVKAQATVASEDGTKTSTSNEATYTFVVAPAPNSLAVTGAENVVAPGSDVTLTAAPTPSASTFNTYTWYTRPGADDEWKAVDGQSGPNLTVEATEGVQYRAAVTGGKDYASGTPVPVEISSEPVTITTQAGPGEQTITIKPLAHHYHSGTVIDVEVVADPDVPNGVFRWYLQRTDESEPVEIEGVNRPAFQLLAEQALHGARIHAELLGHSGEVLATSDIVTIDVDDHGTPPLQKVTIGNLADHYHSGSEIKLYATVNPESVLSRFEWYVKKADDEDPVLIESQHDSELTLTAGTEYDGASIFVKLTYDDGRPYVQSDPVTIHVNDHAADTTLTVTTDKDTYSPGETAHLVGHQDPVTGHDHYHWFIKRVGDSDFSVIRGALEAELAHVVEARDAGAQFVLKLYGDDHEVLAESTPITIRVHDPSSKPEGEPQRQQESELTGPAGGIRLSTTTPAPGELVTIQVGSGTEMSGTWVAPWLFSTPVQLGSWHQVQPDGTIAVRIPDNVEGQHRLAVFNAEGSLIGWEQLEVSVKKPQPDPAPKEPEHKQPEQKQPESGQPETKLPATGSEPQHLAAGAALLLMLGGLGVYLRRSRFFAN